MLTVLKRIVPVALKRPVRDYLNARAWRNQPRLDFDASHLRPAESIDLPSIWLNTATAESFAKDHVKIAELMAPRNIGSGVNPGDRRAIYYLTSHFKPRSVLEIGTHIGASTTYLASALRSFGGHVTTVDIVNVNARNAVWRELGLSAPPAQLLEKLDLASYVTFQIRSAATALQADARYDLIFLDGNHAARSVYREISAALKRLSPDGLILLHDFYPDFKPLIPEGSVIAGPFIAAQRIVAENASLAFLPLGGLPWPTKGGGNATSLALVTRVRG